MTVCENGEKNIENEKKGAVVGISVVSIMSFFFILYLAFLIHSERNKQFGKTQKRGFNFGTPLVSAPPEILPNPDLLGRFDNWFGRASTIINSGTILSIMAAGVVIGFNGLIMTPLITSMFPQKEINDPIQIGKHIYINPGQFFVALIGFILSLILFFFITEIVNALTKNEAVRKVIFSFFLFILASFLIFMLVWNSMHVNEMRNLPDCVPEGTNVNTNFMTLISKENTKPEFGTTPLNSFGVFA